MKKKSPDKIIAMVRVRDKEHLAQLLAEAHHAFVFSDEPLNIFRKAFQSVNKGEQFISAKLSKYMMEFLVLKKDPADIFKETLTERENEIAGLIAKALSSKEIAEKLHLSVHTVDTHRRNILKKLELHSAAELINYTASRKKK